VLRRELALRVEGATPIPAPVRSFMHLNLDDRPALLEALAKAGFEAPTAVQAQALPCLLSGRDVLGLAATGSGKTLAYLLPMLRHCAEQAQPAAGGGSDGGRGPIGLVLAPTRELATQIYTEARRLAKSVGLRVVLLAGGASKYEQSKALAAGAEVVIATPGRLIEHVKDRCVMERRCVSPI
jgi:ATP-dependent RNA helicase DDX42